MPLSTFHGTGTPNIPDTSDKLTISINPLMKRQLKQVAAIRNQSMGDVIAEALRPIIQQELGV
jgi:hypothetical protein